MKRVTARKKFRAKLAAYKEWLKANRSRLTNGELWALSSAKLRGHYACYGVTDNSQGLNRFAYEVRRMLLKWPNRKGGRRPMNWDAFNRMDQRFPLPRPRIRVNLLPAW